MAVQVHFRSVAESILNVEESHLLPIRLLRSVATRDRFRRFVLTDDPSSAQFIVFIESHFDDCPAGPQLGGILKDPVYRKFPSKCFVHCGADRPVPTVPGIYPSIERRWAWRDIVRSGSYVAKPNPFVRHEPMSEQADFLGSFVGSVKTIEVRHRLMKIQDKRVICLDNSKPYIAAVRGQNQPQIDRLNREYADYTIRSKFILCPRGNGASSIRLFEAMEAGRAPVVISDPWVPPDGPDWGSFMIRVEASDIMRIPGILREREPEAAKMGAGARQAWEEHFGPDALFHRICETCEDMMKVGPGRRRLLCNLERLNLLRPVRASRFLTQSKRALGAWIRARIRPKTT